MLAAADKGFGVSKQQVLRKVGQITKAMSTTSTFSKGIPGKAWWRGFRSRHPEVAIRKPEKLSTVRARGLNHVQTGNYFLELLEILERLKLTNKPHLLWNMDESGSSMEHNPTLVCARKGARQVPGRTANTRENNTLVVCVNAAGQSMSTLIIVKGKTDRALQGYSTTEGPPKALWTYQEKAWTEDLLGVEWFHNIFLKQCGKQRPQLLIVDGHHSHEVLGLLEKAAEENIHILCLPPHTTQYLQPLDRTVFGPMKAKYNSVCSEFLSQSPMNIINKWTWPKMLKEAMQASVTPVNIIAGFRACGIVPWNPLAVPQSAFSTSQPFDVEESVDEDRHPLLWVMKKVSERELPSQPEGSKVGVPSTSTVSTRVTEMPNACDVAGLPEEAATTSAATLAGSSDQVDLSIVRVEPTSTGYADEQPQMGSKNWEQEVDAAFELERMQPPKKKTAAAGRVTGHRLLTGEAVMAKKKAEQEKKELKEQEKEARKRKKEEKEKQLQEKSANVAVKSSAQERGKGAGRNGKGKGNKGKAKSTKKTQKVSKCKYCLVSEDEEDGQLWIACDVCKIWMHQDCVPMLHVANMKNSIKKNLDFECIECWELDN